ncbi:MAG: hypothetical protein ACTS5F_01075 [Candidatus Hodgkinia cicadicola]
MLPFRLASSVANYLRKLNFRRALRAFKTSGARSLPPRYSQSVTSDYVETTSEVSTFRFTFPRSKWTTSRVITYSFQTKLNFISEELYLSCSTSARSY